MMLFADPRGHYVATSPGVLLNFTSGEGLNLIINLVLYLISEVDLRSP